ncbi:MAG: DNA-3-methyladenine glycosylase [Synoicihabitans sp.]
MSTSPDSWRPLVTTIRFNATSFAELLDGGQAFRWQRHSSGVFRGYWDDRIAELALDESVGVKWRAVSSPDQAFETDLRHYLNLPRTEPAAPTDELPWRSDAHLARCMEAFPGLRILRQPFGETLLGFLCSATKQILQIKQMMALLAEKHGAVRPKCHHNGDTLEKPLPTWDQLARSSETDLRACQLGFRARYIKGTADYLQANPGWLEHTAGLPYAEAKKALCTLPGVGEKIADCVALFGLGHDEAFPVDTWMIKAMERRYGLHGWSPTQIAHFGRVHFGAKAGLAQQYLFAWERAYGKK